MSQLLTRWPITRRQIILTGRNARRYHALSNAKSRTGSDVILLSRLLPPPGGGVRYFGIAIIARQLLKIRYWVLGGSVAGGVALKDRYENLKSQLPDIPDFAQFFPEATATELHQMWDRIKDNAETGSGVVVGFAHEKLNRANTWLLDLEKRLGTQIREGIVEDDSASQYASPNPENAKKNAEQSHNGRPPYSVLFLGTDQYSVYALEALRRHFSPPERLKIARLGVCSRFDEPVCELAQHSQQLQLPLFKYTSESRFSGWDVGVVASFGDLIPADVIASFPYGILCIHPSLLPRWRGASPLMQTILHDDALCGVSVMRITPWKFDVGGIVRQEKMPLPAGVTSRQLGEMLMTRGVDLLIDVLSDLPGALEVATPQSRDGVTYARKITIRKTFVDWDGSADGIDRLQRALAEDFGVRTYWEGEVAKLSEFVQPDWTKSLRIDELRPRTVYSRPGELFFHKKRNVLFVRCRDGWVGLSGGFDVFVDFPDGAKRSIFPMAVMASKPTAPKESIEERRKRAEAERALREAEEDLTRLHSAGQQAIDRLEAENRELRDVLNDIRDAGRDRTVRPSSQSPIEMYSEILDLLSVYDTSFNTQDHLPRIVVVGDQSAGKTSVLEMIAQARIFPRGAGEMMTRAPVQVTLSDGPDRIARFRDSSRDYDLDDERDLVDLRREIELRMRASVRGGRTVSKDVISLSVKGPGLSRMVLVDLPGIIATVTADMASDTKDTIYSLSRSYMTNPNAIILCIQDGSIDAERSNVTDLVSSIDPDGSRTIFVLTKIDMAERSVMNPDRIRKILEGKLFPMKALGYFAVVTGRGNVSDSIEDIQRYEQEYFRTSLLMKKGIFKAHQTTTKNLSHAVSERFWKMVKDTVEAQSLALTAQRFNLEAEWKNHFPKHRPMDRKELYERSRVKIMDEVMTACLTSNINWIRTIEESLWKHFAPYLFENIYFPAASSETRPMFNTIIDIKLREWREKNLEQMCLTVGSDAMKDEIRKLVEHNAAGDGDKEQDSIYDVIKKAAVDAALEKHQWERQALDRLRTLVANALDDSSIATSLIWDHAVEFWQNAVVEKLTDLEGRLRQETGPGFRERWLSWRSASPAQRAAKETLLELDKLQKNLEQRKVPHLSDLSADDVSAVRKNLELKKIPVDGDVVRHLWTLLREQAFLKDASKRAENCRSCFYRHQKGSFDDGDSTNCDDVLLFSRVRRMISQTSRSLAQQIDESEVRRFERELKRTVNEFGQGQEGLQRFFSGKRVDLAEKLKQIRAIQEKLDVFVATLSDEERTKRAKLGFSIR
ncbi:Dynamin-like 120 kDa protein, mitochondrial [Hypsibius exemplaris]|uniref:Dynamin-like GTPase OPA1, mitochondrial n=1 Tax=Hypsibius exemplaris TaxID=2072580 RepID=A0A1W0W876_HYPEX|nr:Dynamin-like 120 kDa protein, mitochondrial [Hypsibius exemplaris]